MLRNNTLHASNTPLLQATHDIVVRFSEVDAMRVVWHGAYPLYFEDARETFGTKFGLEYMRIADNGYYAPLVALELKYLRPLFYGEHYTIEITYTPSLAAKIIFDYKIYDEQGLLHTTGHSVQVFMDMNYQLLWYKPEFYLAWQKKCCGDDCLYS